MVETGCKLIESLLGEPCKVAGNMLADQIYAYQWRNRIKIACKAQELMAQSHVTPRVLPPGFLVSLLDEAGNVDDEKLQDMWASLLASAAADEKYVQTAYKTTLSQLSRAEALILSTPKPVYELSILDTLEERRLLEDFIRARKPGALIFPRDEFMFYRCHLNSLDLATTAEDLYSFNHKFEQVSERARMGNPHPDEMGKYSFYEVTLRLTLYGELFMKACAPK
jgi:hypothetical protein